jgi:hypothetical protein
VPTCAAARFTLDHLNGFLYLFLDFCSLLSRFNDIEHRQEFLEPLLVSFVYPADLLQESYSDLNVLFYEHLLLALGAHILCGISISPIVFLI